MKHSLILLFSLSFFFISCNYQYGGLRGISLETSGSEKFKITNVSLPSGCEASFATNITQGQYKFNTSYDSPFQGSLGCNPPEDVIDLNKSISVTLIIGSVRGKCSYLKAGSKYVYTGYAYSKNDNGKMVYSISFSSFSFISN